MPYVAHPHCNFKALFTYLLFMINGMINVLQIKFEVLCIGWQNRVTFKSFENSTGIMALK